MHVSTQAAQGRAARKKLGKGGKLDPQHLSPACVWLDAQHDARHGARFIESITGKIYRVVALKFRVALSPPRLPTGVVPHEMT